MLLSIEIATNPGPRALFVAELRIEKKASINLRHAWWGIWLGWWLFPVRDWREWLFAWEYTNDKRWHTLMCRVVGFELNLQLWRKKTYG